MVFIRFQKEPPVGMDSIPSNGQVKKETSCCRINLRQEVICMARKYTKMEYLAEIVKERKAAGETNRTIAESYGLTKKQIKQLVSRQNQKGGQGKGSKAPR